MKQNSILEEESPLCTWGKQAFINRLRSSTSNLKQLKIYLETESHGVRQIYIRIGLSAKGHILAGISTLGIYNLAVETDVLGNQSIHKYFDSQTGQFLGHSKMEALENLLRIAHNLSNQGDTSKALEYFNNAHNFCQSHNNPHMGKFLERDQNQKYSHTITPAQVSTEIVEKIHQNFTAISSAEATNGINMNQPIADLEASVEQVEETIREDEHNKSLLIPNQESFMGKENVLPKYNLLAEILPQKSEQNVKKKVGIKKTLKSPAQVKQEEDERKQNDLAERYYQTGLSSLWRKDYADAQLAFENAYLNCTSNYVNKPKFYEKQLEAELGIRRLVYEKMKDEAAEQLYNQGISRLHMKDYVGARVCFSEAYDRCSQNCERKRTYFESRQDADRQLEKRMREESQPKSFQFKL